MKKWKTLGSAQTRKLFEKSLTKNFNKNRAKYARFLGHAYASSMKAGVSLFISLIPKIVQSTIFISFGQAFLKACGVWGGVSRS
ncbi:MAG: hypothetical protein FWE11_10700 [Defluviitaleaceae bacterium]|nr:hypothetical protein [Defluviitaleaceae bacterium]